MERICYLCATVLTNPEISHVTLLHLKKYTFYCATCKKKFVTYKNEKTEFKSPLYDSCENICDESKDSHLF